MRVFSPEDAVISSVGVSASGTLLENEIMFSPVAR